MWYGAKKVKKDRGIGAGKDGTCPDCLCACYKCGHGSKPGSRSPAPHGNELSYYEALEAGSIFQRGSLRNVLK